MIDTEKYREIIHDLSVTLVRLAGGGTECFMSMQTHNETMYYADARECEKRIQHKLAIARNFARK